MPGVAAGENVPSSAGTVVGAARLLVPAAGDATGACTGETTGDRWPLPDAETVGAETGAFTTFPCTEGAGVVTREGVRPFVADGADGEPTTGLCMGEENGAELTVVVDPV